MKLDRPITVREIASAFQVSYAGDPDQQITGINEIHMVENGDITFVDHPKYYDRVLRSAATTIIINKEVPCPDGKSLVFSEDPFSVYVSLVKKYRKLEHSTRMISETAEIGEGTHIQPGVFIGHYVKIGKNCLIHPNVTIYDHTVIGDHCVIHSGSVLGADAYYFKRRSWGYEKLECCGRVVLQDRVEVGACCTIDKGVSGDTVIGEGTKCDNHVQVGHDTIIGKNCLIGCASVIAGVTRLEDDVILWGQVAIQKDLVIGKGAVVFAKSGVDKSLEGGKTYFGAPVQESRKAWKELAYIRRLPELFSKIGL
ncbi:MAG: UDP-3-O-(3-hydroxymyristoyl)glucosamine N-acyltransferase [Bacteroidetes bacterium]|nr:UDP-3-O-(3-hydroxymyristoyl)glucosamine N-acyltransferase [Bacteroidota bacterium]